MRGKLNSCVKEALMSLDDSADGERTLMMQGGYGCLVENLSCPR